MLRFYPFPTRIVAFFTWCREKVEYINEWLKLSNNKVISLDQMAFPAVSFVVSV
jgi:hypothetical protein